MSNATNKFKFRRMNQWLQLASLTLVYVVGELSHFLLPVVTTPMSQDIHYGDHGCLSNPAADDLKVPDDVYCYTGNSSHNCEAIWQSGTNVTACVWDYSGLGMQYQMLAGPAFVVVFTVSGVVMGFVADKWNRKLLIAACLALLTVATALLGTATEYWHLVVLRMLVGAGESAFAPAASSIIGDLFRETIRAFALGIFNWGIYLGYGLAYLIGNYVTASDIGGTSWRSAYYFSGGLGVMALVVLLLVVREPKRVALTRSNSTLNTVAVENDLDNFSHVSAAGPISALDDANEDDIVTVANGELVFNDSTDSNHTTNKDGDTKKAKSSLIRSEICATITSPAMLMLCLAASVRHTGGFTWAYNTQLYFQTYYPSFPVGMWVSWVSIVGGSVGVAVGGLVSDRVVTRLGLRGRLYVLALSQLLATPFATGVLLLSPPAALFSLLGAYLFAEMWFGILFAVLLDLIPESIRSTTLAVFLFVMNNIGGNAPILVQPLSKVVPYRTALLIFYPGCFLLSSVLFLLTSFFIPKKKKTVQSQQNDGQISST